MNLIERIQSVPTNLLIFLALTIALGMFFYITGNWTRETQMIVFGMLIVIAIISMKESKPKIDLEQAKKIALDWAREKRQLNVIKGNIKESVEGVTRERNGSPWYHECAVVVENPHPLFYILSVSLGGKIRKTTCRKSWSAKDAPDLEIVTPPDFLSWYKLQKKAEEELEEYGK